MTMNIPMNITPLMRITSIKEPSFLSLFFKSSTNTSNNYSNINPFKPNQSIPIMSNNVSDRLSNTANSYIGGAKQSIGQTVGNESLAASGAEQKAQADTAQAAADARTHAEGAGHTIQGKVQQTVGSATGNTSMEARGHANEAKGDIERRV